MNLPYHTLRLWMRPGRTLRPYIFITGAPRSGTTLVKSILRAHPEIGGGDYESTGIFKPRDLSRFFSGEVPQSEVDRLVRTSRTLAEFYERFTDATLAFHGESGRFVDKVWPGSARLLWVPLFAPDALWINVVRDGRDCYCSARPHKGIIQAKDVETFARYWTRCLREAKRLPQDRTFTLRYEDLCADPDAVITRMMSFLRMDTHPLQFDVASRSRGTMKTRAHHARLASGITASTVERWRREMSEGEAGAFNRIAESALQDAMYAV